MKRTMFIAVIASISLAGCGKSSPPPPSRAELTQIYQFELGEYAKAQHVYAEDISDSADLINTLYFSDRAYISPYVPKAIQHGDSSKEATERLNMFIDEDIPETKRGDIHSFITMTKSHVEDSWEKMDQQRERTKKAKAALDATRD